MITFTESGGAAATDLWELEKPPADLYPPGALIPRVITAALQTPEVGFHTEFKMFVISEYDASIEGQVWLVRPTYDSTGQVDGLASSLLSAFACGPLRRQRACLSISGSYIEYFSFCEDEEEVKVAAIVIDWKQANGQRDFDKIPKHVVSDNEFFHHDVLSILPNGTFWTHSIGGFELWDILSIAPVFNIDDADPDDLPVTVGGPVLPSDTYATISTSVFADGAVKISHTGNHEEICYTTISEEGVETLDASMAFLRVVDGHYPCFVLLGIDRGIKFFDPHSAQCVKFRREGAQVTDLECQNLLRKNMHMDSYSGTMVLGQSNVRMTVIADFPFR